MHDTFFSSLRIYKYHQLSNFEEVRIHSFPPTNFLSFTALANTQAAERSTLLKNTIQFHKMSKERSTVRRHHTIPNLYSTL